MFFLIPLSLSDWFHRKTKCLFISFLDGLLTFNSKYCFITLVCCLYCSHSCSVYWVSLPTKKPCQRKCARPMSSLLDKSKNKFSNLMLPKYLLYSVQIICSRSITYNGACNVAVETTVMDPQSAFGGSFNFYSQIIVFFLLSNWHKDVLCVCVYTYWNLFFPINSLVFKPQSGTFIGIYWHKMEYTDYEMTMTPHKNNFCPSTKRGLTLAFDFVMTALSSGIFKNMGEH